MKERWIAEFFYLAMGLDKEAEGWWGRLLYSPHSQRRKKFLRPPKIWL
jgi:hypothetical protein